MKRKQNKKRVPISTYRLQLGPQLRWRDLPPVLEYLRQLGIGDLYLSPMLTPQPGSTHGYDAADHSCVNPELGTPDEFTSVMEAVRAQGMGVIADVVPNHMGIAHDRNWRWWDVLENGPSSLYARYFDIDWSPPQPELQGKVLLPILGDQYGRMLENAEIQVHYERGVFTLRVYDRKLPLAPKSWIRILQPAAELLMQRLGSNSEQVLEMQSIITALRNLPKRGETQEELQQERYREKEIVKRRLRALTSICPACEETISAVVQQINGQPGSPDSFNELDALIDDQAYRISYWRVAADEINYRRFFDINELAAIRVEDEKVFHEVHERILEWVGRGWITGLRVDHPDGLFDPAGYFGHLQQACRTDMHSTQHRSETGIYVVAEKILHDEERLRSDWQVDGTTGYDALSQLNRLFVYQPGLRQIDRQYRQWSHHTQTWDEIVYESKRLILKFSLSSELNVLARWLDRLCDRHRWSRDFTLETLRLGLREVVASFPVYRTYGRASLDRLEATDRRHIESAVEKAKFRNPSINASVFDTIGQLLQLEHPPGATSDLVEERRQFAFRFQQFTSPVMAKSLEDTAFYRYTPLASLNEVGGGPEPKSGALARFHQDNQRRQTCWPGSMVATATHDTKRGEDTRARLNVLSEMPNEWSGAVRHWHALNRIHRTSTPHGEFPDRHEEYLLYQTLVGTWPGGGLTEEERPLYTSRIVSYMEKALREAKVHTSWISPNPGHDQAVRHFVEAVLDPTRSPDFLASINTFLGGVQRAGFLNSLSQTALKLTMPGVPDTYQGCELWDFSLVDPDNRRPVDFEQRRRMLRSLCTSTRAPFELAECMMKSLADGRAKMWLTQRALHMRREMPSLFRDGQYVGLAANGPAKRHIVGFARVHESAACITIAGRFWYQLGTPSGPLPATLWPETSLRLSRTIPRGSYQDAFTGRMLEITSDFDSLPIEQVLGPLPAACLVRMNG